MSWLPNPFKSLQLPDAEESASDAGGGSVKEDLSVIGETIGRQLRGVAAFLAPPPPTSQLTAADPVADEDSGDTRSPRIAGIRNDLAEISGSFKSSLSLLSSNKAVIEISKLASNFLQLDVEEEEEEIEKEDHGVGITDEIVDFVTKISDRPECWTDFPLPLNDNDFTISDAQAEHISVMEQLVPSLADLRTKLSSGLTEKQFWMIYFIVLLPRLDENSLNLLSTPEIVEARTTLLAKLQHKRNLVAAKDHVDDSSQSDSKCEEKGREKIVVADNEETSARILAEKEGNTGKSSEEEYSNTGTVDAPRHLQSEDEISFSDLEDDDTDLSTRRYGSGHVKGRDAGSSSPDGSSDWVQLNENAGSGRRRRSRDGHPSSQNRDSEGESSDWLSIDEFDHYN